MPKLNQKEQVSFCTQDLTVIKDHPFLYTLDGELYQTNKNQINISLGPTISFVMI